MNTIPIRIVYYEDNKALREGMSFLLQATPGLQLLGAFPNCDHLTDHLLTLQPQVVLMDIDMPGMPGTEAVALIKATHPAVQVLMLTVFENEDKIFQAIRNGANGYLLKHTSPSGIVEAIFDLHNGGSPMTASVARKVLQYFQQPKVARSDYNLSEREVDILRGLTKGHSYKMIADELFISVETVRTHVRHVYDKLHVNSKAEAIIKAMREGLV
ncbi:response regulator transcription factor [Nibrella saemangeumensis]|uniref:Response regulator transcription factor n=1 Tax=Nibrella saemangeumensis TaxID=1084526 RepID=A0ABP8MTT9_9BACT